MYLVITGNEYGYDLNNMTDLTFLPKDKAEEAYDKYLEESGCAAMYEVLPTGLKLVKQEAEF